MFIIDKCDHAGIWVVNWRAAEFFIGEKFNIKEVIKTFNGRIQIFDNGEKWFIEKFIEFQYGELNPSNRVHKSVLDILIKNNLQNKDLLSPLQGAKDKDKDIYKDKVKDKEKENAREVSNNSLYFTDFKKLEKEMLTSQMWIESVCMKYSLELIQVTKKLADFILHLKSQGESGHDLLDAKRYFSNWLGKNLPEGNYKPPPERVLKFPDKWDEVFSLNLTTEEEEKYHAYLRSLGFQPQFKDNKIQWIQQPLKV